MLYTELKTGLEVVRTSGDYLGNIGVITSIINDNTVAIKWNGGGGGKIKITQIEPASTPYEIRGDFKVCKKTGRITRPKYIKL